MERKKAKFDFRLMNSLGQLKDEEFKIAYFILNSIGMNDGKRTKIYRAVMAEWAGKSEKTISRITDKLNEQGIIKKDLVSDGVKTSNYYSYPCPKTEQNLDTDVHQSTSKLDTDVPLNKRYKSDKIEKMNNIEKMDNIEKELDIDFFEKPIVEKREVPDEETLAEYLERTQGHKSKSLYY